MSTLVTGSVDMQCCPVFSIQKQLSVNKPACTGTVATELPNTTTIKVV